MRAYRVGRGKPPKKSQFKKGRSGNPKGRPPKMSPDLDSDLDRVLNQKITVRENGRERRLSIREAMLRTVSSKGLQGDTKALTALLTMQERAQKKRPPAQAKTIDPNEIEILRHFFPRLKRMVNSNDESD